MIKLRISRKDMMLALLAGASAIATVPAAAQPAAADGSPQLDEIVVTAQRREERLQDVPVSVTALSSQALEARQVTDVMSLARVVPSMQIKPTFSNLEVTLAIRGVTQLLPSITVDPSIGVYVDEVYNVLNAGTNTGMIDMERVEVLRGPQGALFGRNTIGGAINITTASPTDQFGGYVQGEVGDYGAWTATGVVNLPISAGVIDSRLVYQHTEHDGYGHNFTTGNPTNTFEQDYFRASLRLRPAEDWEILFRGAHVYAEGFQAGTRLGFFDTTSSLAPGFLPPNDVFIPLASGRPGDLMSNYVLRGGHQDTFSDIDGTFKLQQTTASAAIVGKLNEAVTFKSITAFADTYYDSSTDLDGTPYGYLSLVPWPLHSKQYSQEFQLYGDALDDRLQWITGLYYFRTTGDQVSHLQALLATAQAFAPGAPLTETNRGPDVENKSYSAFAQLTYALTPTVKLTAGARYVVDKREATYRDNITVLGGGAFLSCALANAPGSTNPAACVISDDVKYDYVPWTVGIDWKPTEEVLLYAKISKGYRSGAYNTSGPVAVTPSATVTPAQAAAANAAALALFGPVAPEKLTSYEAGAKMDLLDRRLRVNGAVFYSDYSNIQVSTNEQGGCATCAPISILTNSGVAEIYGGELEVTALLGALQLDLGAGYAHPKYVEGPFLGDPVINVSKFSGSINATYPIHLDAGVLTLVGTYSYRSKARLYPLAAGPGAIPTLDQEGFGLLDALVSFELESVPVVLSAYVRNLTDEKYFNTATNFGPPLSGAVNWPGAPRTVGASLKYSF